MQPRRKLGRPSGWQEKALFRPATGHTERVKRRGNLRIEDAIQRDVAGERIKASAM